VLAAGDDETRARRLRTLEGVFDVQALPVDGLAGLRVVRV
jgi:hypothetical protein